MSKKEKKKKEKVVYIDDGRTIADMSNVTGLRKPKNNNQGQVPDYLGNTRGRKSTYKDHWKTYWSAVKMMFLPMLVTIGILCIAFLVAWLFFNFAG